MSIVDCILDSRLTEWVIEDAKAEAEYLAQHFDGVGIGYITN